MGFLEKSYKERIRLLLDLQSNKESIKNRLNALMELQVLECDEADNNWSEYSFELKEFEMNPYDGLHGGMACAIVDTCGGNSIAAATGKAPSTTDLSISYIRPMNAKKFRVRVEFTLRGHKLYGTQVNIYNFETGELCASSMLKYILMNREAIHMGEEDFIKK